MMKSRLRIHLSLLLALLFAVALQATPAQAHAALVRSDPADNAVLTAAPSEIRMWFNEEISAEFSSARLLNISGEEIQPEGLRRDADDPMLLILALPELPDGVYSVNWKVLSEADGHFTQGLLVFGIGQDADLGSISATDTSVNIPFAEVFLRWFKFSFLALLLGSFIVRSFIIRPDHVRHDLVRSDRIPLELQTAFRHTRRRLEGLAFGASFILILVGFGLLIFQLSSLLATLPENVAVLAALRQLVINTRWGQLWLTGQIVVLAVAGFLWPARRSLTHFFAGSDLEHSTPVGPLAGLFAGILATSLIVLQSLVSHAASVTPQTGIAVFVDSLHLVAVAGWVGSLFAILGATLPLLRGKRRLLYPFLQSTWSRFGFIAAVSVGVIFATGLYSTGRQVVTPDALLTSLYGQALIGKVVLVLAAGAAGLVNSVLLHPSLAAPLGRLIGRPPGWRPLGLDQLPKLVLIEASLGVLILLTVSLITSAPPARGPEYELAGMDLRESISQNADDMVVTLIVKPNLPGPNVFSILATSTRRPPPAEVLRVIVRFTYLQQDFGTVTVDAEPDGEDRYRIGGNYFSLAGPWLVEVAVRRQGLEDAVAKFEWNVAPSSASRPVIISNRPWEEPLAMIAAGLLGATIITASIYWLFQKRQAGQV